MTWLPKPDQLYMNQAPLFSVIVPSKGNRPRALARALTSVETAHQQLIGITGQHNIVEVLVGFDGVGIQKVVQLPYIRWYKFPYEGYFGNAIRNGLLKAAKGRYILFLDDDNALTTEALSAFYPFLDQS